MAKKLLSTWEAAAELGCCQNKMLHMARAYPGLGFLFGRAWRFPVENIAAVRAGEPVEDVAAKARERGAAQAA